MGGMEYEEDPLVALKGVGSEFVGDLMWTGLL